jgi:hypothetical protein
MAALSKTSFLKLFLVSFTLVSPGMLFGQELKKTEDAEAVQTHQPDPFSGDPDPFAAAESKPAVPVGNGQKKTTTLLLRVEVFQLPVSEAILVLDEEMSGEDMRKKFLKMVTEKKVEIVSLHATRFDVGTTATMEGVVEDIYPTEYESPESLPQGSPLLRPQDQLSPSEKIQKTALTFASPSAFDTKNLGATLEAVAEEVTAEEGMWDLRFTLTEVSHLKDDSWVEGTVTMPIFKVNSVKGGSRVKEGSWDLWSCQAETGEDGKPDLSNLRAVLVQLKQVKR